MIDLEKLKQNRIATKGPELGEVLDHDFFVKAKEALDAIPEMLSCIEEAKQLIENCVECGAERSMQPSKWIQKYFK